MKTIKYLFPVVLLLISLMTGCSTKSDINNQWNIADTDSMYLEPPIPGERYQISDALFKAIDPRYVANKYGVTKSTYFSKRLNDYWISKTFELIAFDYYRIPNYDDNHFLTSLNVRKKWSYFINDNLMQGYSRVLVSALKLQAIDRIEYNPSDTTGWDLGWRDTDSRWYDTKSRDGTIHVYTRDISKNTTNDRTTLYLLNDQVVTRKVYDAINPVYIRLLKRITDKVEIAEYRQHKNIKEIVKVDLFTYEELVTGDGIRLFILDECPECNIYLVDNVQIDIRTYEALNSLYFKEFRQITEDEEEAFAPYQELFPKEAFGLPKNITVVLL